MTENIEGTLTTCSGYFSEHLHGVEDFWTTKLVYTKWYPLISPHLGPAGAWLIRSPLQQVDNAPAARSSNNSSMTSLI